MLTEKHLAHDVAGEAGYQGWAPDKVAASLLSAEGYHKFCALMKYKPQERRYEVAYSYCDLLFSRMVTTYVERQPRYRDHRAIFRAVPGMVIFTWFLLALPLPVLYVAPVPGAVLLVITATLAAAAAGMGIHALASLQYAREHYDAMAQEFQRRLRSLNEGLEVIVRERTEQLRVTEARRANLSRFLSPRVVDLVMEKDASISLGGLKCTATVLFCDIRGFTPLSEQLPSDKLIDLLNQHFTALTEVVFHHQGTLDKYMGDEIMAVFGAPYSGENDVASAVAAALEMQTVNKALNLKRTQAGLPTFEIGIGVDTGEVVAGYIGSPNRFDYTVIGNHVNSARRLCSLAKAGAVVAGDGTYSVVGNRVDALALGDHLLRGKREPVACYSITALRRD
jgi:class 3 adenylate cyclase